MGTSKLQNKLNSGVANTENLLSKGTKELNRLAWRKRKRWLTSNCLQENQQRHWKNKLYDAFFGQVLEEPKF